MGLVCQRCSTNAGLYKEILDEGYLIIHCTRCGWRTGKLDRHAYENYVDHIPTVETMHKDGKDWQ